MKSMSLVNRYQRKWISSLLVIALMVTALLPSGLTTQVNTVKANTVKATVAEWILPSATELMATGGTTENVGASLLSISGSRALTYTGSSKTVYANGWDTANSYWQIQLNTTGYSDLDLTYKAYGSNTGPKDFTLQYSLTGADDSFIALAPIELTNSLSSYGPFQLPEELSNKEEIFVRWINTSTASINGGTSGSSGTSRIADIVIEGVSLTGPKTANVVATPEANAWPIGTQISLSSATEGATIHYAADASTEYEVYNEPIELNEQLTISAYASSVELADSDAASFEYELLEKSNIAVARTAARNRNVWTEGIITHMDGAKVYIQDETGAIVLYGMNIADASVGDRVHVQGIMDIYSGLQELKSVPGLTYHVMEKQVGAPAPKLLTASDLAPASGEQVEAQIVYLENVTIDRKAGSVFKGKQDNIEFDIYSSLPALEPGKTFQRIIGVIEEYNGNYQLIPLHNGLIENLFSVSADPAAGAIVTGTGVILSTPTAGATIHYTIDGSTPTMNSPIYIDGITIDKNMTINAIVVLHETISDSFQFNYHIVSDSPKIHEIQGETHSSPYVGQIVNDVQGIVTQYAYQFATGAYRGFYIQDAEPDDNENTSDAIYVYSTVEATKPAIGDLVSVTGKVEEYNEGSSTNLTTTELTNVTIEVQSSGHELPEPIVLGKGGRSVPDAIIDNDSFTIFDPIEDAIDFYESLEGMLVTLSTPTILSPYWTSGQGNSQLYNIPTRIEQEIEEGLTPAGGLVLKEAGNLNPQRLLIAYSNPGQELATGDVFKEDVIGVVGYNHGNFKVIPSHGALPAIEPSAWEQEVTTLDIEESKLTIATYNVENFHPGVSSDKINRIAASIVNNLKAPDIIGLVEVQDNNGATDNGTVAADLSYTALITAIAAAGGPTYSFTDVAPEDKKDGGEPGGNIRVGYLYNPERVTLSPSVTDEAATATTAVSYDVEKDLLSHNPGRIDPMNEAFSSSRKPLAAQFEFNGEKVIAIVNHFNSKGGDHGPFGATQPPILSSELQRHQMAEIVNGFVKDVVTANANANVVVMGDFNDFQFTDTLSLLKGSELTNLVDMLPAGERYTYTFDGNSQTLDHMLVSNNVKSISEIDIVHINADFPLSKGRASDHDPLLIQLDLENKTDLFPLRVLHSNDTHARLDNVAKRVTAIQEHKNDHSILLDAGDVFSGTLYFTKYEGLADLEFMNMVGYDAMAPGNHEFDKGPEAFERFIRAAEFPIVSANIDYSLNEGLGELFKNEIGGIDTDVLEGHIYPAIVLDVNGEQVGVFGLTTEETVGISSPGETLQFHNYIERAKATVESLQQEGINKIIALTHIGYSFDEVLAAEVEGIDIIVGGHSHTQLNAPTVINEDAEPTLIVQTGEYGANLGVVDAMFDEDGVLTTWNGRLISVADYEEDEVAQEKLLEYKESLDEMMAEIVGHTLVDLNDEAIIDGKLQRAVRRQETNLGNLITDGMAAAMKEKITALLPAEELASIKGYVALQNGGGIREMIPAGDITLGQVRTVLPFDNSLVAVKVTGEELILALENGVSGAPAENGGFAHVSGMKVVFDSTKAPQTLDKDAGTITSDGERIVQVQVKSANNRYSAIDPNAYYMLATNSFTAKGGDFYYALKQATDDRRIYELYLPDYEVFLEHISKFDEINIGVEGRITDLKGKSLPNPGGGGGPGGSSEDSGSGEEPPAGSSDDSSKQAVKVNVNSEDIQQSRDAQDKKVTTITVKEEALKAALAQTKANTNGHSVLIEHGTFIEGSIQVQLPAKALLDAGKQTVISVSAGSYSYELPLHVLALETIAASTGIAVEDLVISVRMEIETGAIAHALAEHVNDIGAELQGSAISFAIMAEGNGKAEGINQFGNTFVERTIELDQDVDSKGMTVITYDAATNQSSFVPATFSVVDGKTIIVIKRNSNSVYAIVAASKSFSDLSNHWAKDDIEQLASKLIAQGKTDIKFDPNSSITRAEFAVLLVRALGLKEEQSNAVYVDIDSAAWYAGAIGAASNAGLITGFLDDTFRPSENITREQLAVMISRALAFTGHGELAGSVDGAVFKDGAAIQAWARAGVSTSVAAGIIQGRTDQLFSPAEQATRAEAVTMLKRLLKFIEFI